MRLSRNSATLLLTISAFCFGSLLVGYFAYISMPRCNEIEFEFADMSIVELDDWVSMITPAPIPMEVQLPESAASALPPEDEEPLSISISKDGSVALQATEISIDELVPRLRAVMAERGSDKIFIRGDREIQYEFVMQVMGALNNAGFRNIGLITDPGDPTFDGGGS